MGDPRCKWVRDRLPLLAGGELLGLERRRVERHLIGCARCRDHRAALSNALDVLHAAAGVLPSTPDAPSLWPALARQIQESRRPVSRPVFSPVRWRLAIAAGLLLAFGVSIGAVTWRQWASAQLQIASGSQRIDWPELPIRPRPVAIVSTPAPSTEQVVQAEPAPEPAPPPRYDYMLDHGTPMPPDTVDSKSSTRPTY